MLSSCCPAPSSPSSSRAPAPPSSSSSPPPPLFCALLFVTLPFPATGWLLALSSAPSSLSSLPSAAAAAALDPAAASLSSFMRRPRALMFSSFLSTFTLSMANSTMGRRSAVKAVGLLLSWRRQAMAWSCLLNSMKPSPLDRGLPSGPTLPLSSSSRKILTCLISGFSLQALSFTALVASERSLASVIENGMLRTLSRVELTTKLGDLSLVAFSSAPRLRFCLSCSDMPVHAGEPTGMSPSFARYRLRLSLPWTAVPALDAASCLAPSWLSAKSTSIGRPPTTTPGPRFCLPLAHASAAFLAPSGALNSTKAVPLGLEEALSITSLHALTRPYASIFACS
mmetsp:Transcript_7530/g.20041  ORF Transcript_7530/g.20041 Transcript_7530/m.20041 type:complete len:340 (-) Transcript_7530:198-1217(-)